jgi:hypothetical protein
LQAQKDEKGEEATLASQEHVQVIVGYWVGIGMTKYPRKKFIKK